MRPDGRPDGVVTVDGLPARVRARIAPLVDQPCKEGYSASLVADTLGTLRLVRSWDVIGGFSAWASAGLPTVRPGRRDAAA
jgi:rhodanese-related sulfurtransferase